MWVRAITYVLLVAVTSPIWLLLGAFARPARAAVVSDCCAGVTAAYGLVFTDHCDRTVTVTVANPSTVVGRVTINAQPTFTVAPNTATTRHAATIGGILTLSVTFSGRPDTILHEWSKPTTCTGTPTPPATADPAPATAPPTPAPARNAHPSTSPPARARVPVSGIGAAAPQRSAPSATAAAAALEDAGIVNTPSGGHATIWQTRDSNSVGYPLAAVALLTAVLAMVFPYRRTRPPRSKT